MQQLTDAATTAPARARWQRERLLRPETLIVGAAVAVIGYLTLVPLTYLLWRTFVHGGELTLEFFRDAYSAYGLGSMLANSAVFASGSTALAVILGTGLAYLVVRTDLPGKTFFLGAALVPLAIPGVLYTICWIFLASPRTGTLNRALEPVFGPGALDVFGMGGMIVVEGLHLAPLVFLFMAAAFRSVDSSFEESALASGARLTTVLRRVTLPLVRPALVGAVLITAVRALESFEVPALLGIPGGVWVFTSRIWRSLGQYPFDLGEAGAYALSLLLLTSAGVFLASRLVRRDRSYQTLTGRGARQRPLRLGGWRVIATVVAAAYIVIAVVLPLLILVYVSTQPYYRPLSRKGLSSMSLSSYGEVFSSDLTIRALGNSAILSVGTATAVMLVMAIAAWLVVRTRIPGRWLVDDLAFLPIAVPGLVLGVALLFVYLRVPIPVYGTLWILFIAYFTRFMPYGMRYGTASMTQIARELEESAKTCGAGWWTTFRRVLLPLLLPGLAAGWIAVVVLSLRELSSSILLYSPGNEVLSIAIWEQYASGRFPELAALGVGMTVALVLLLTVAFRAGARARLFAR